MRSALVVFCLSLTACAGSVEDRPSDDSVSDALINGTLDTDHKQVGIVWHTYASGTNGMCTGSLVGTHTVLTAGHCVYEEVGGPSATPDRMSFVLDGVRYSVTRVFLHPGYDPAHVPVNDIAVLELYNDIPDLQPLRIASVPPQVGQKLVLVGFGRTSDTTPTDQMRRSGVNDVANIRDYDFTMYGASGADSGVCHGDSGGPSLATTSTGTVIAGVHSTATCDRVAIVDGVDSNASNDVRVDAYNYAIKLASMGNLYSGGSYEQAPPTISIERLQLSGSGERGTASDDFILRVKAADDQRLDRIAFFVNGQRTQTIMLNGEPSYVGDVSLGAVFPGADGQIWIQAAVLDRGLRRTNADLWL